MQIVVCENVWFLQKKTLKTFLVFRVFLLYLHRDNMRNYVETGENS